MSNSSEDLQRLSLDLYSASRLLIQSFQNLLIEIPLTYPQFLVMRVLWEKDGLYVNQIGEKLHLDSGTLTPLLKKLEAHNFVKRMRSEKDERKVKIELTFPGKSLQKKTQEVLSQLEPIFENFQEKTFTSLNTSLKDLLDHLNPTGK